LSPFDSLFWARDRDQQLWGFEQTLEAYKPAPQRIWGYFCLPILHHDRLVGRFDPKLERKTGTLRLKSLLLEPGIDPAEDLIADVAAALRDFMEWHGAHDLIIEKSSPPEFGERLMQSMGQVSPAVAL
ncbi:MAG: winged helix DNA-binding domain-containing protein, partial [Chloroflexi bacterium]|nr:winged helix DNA-binding domain-containing protein [Chloroflexota bacterium]